MPQARRSYDSHFKEGAVRVVRETGKSIEKVAQDLGIPKATLTNWVREDRRRRGERADPATVDMEKVRQMKKRSLSCGWSVMSSSDQWSSGSKIRCGERGVVHRLPEGRPWCPPRPQLPGPGGI